jgi:GNAT superfamily N-acetyltransferase
LLGGVEFRAPNPAEHAEAIYALLATHWEGIDAVCRNGRIAHSHLDWEVSRIALIGGRLVAYWGVYDLQMRVGRARVRTAGINLPVTHPELRGRGLMPQVIAHSLAAKRARGYGLSVINNTHAYFTRFGYVFAWPQTHFYVKTEDLPAEPPTLHLVEANGYELMGRADLAEIYNRQNACVTGTAVRPTYRRSKHPMGDFALGYLLVDDEDRAVGYFLDGPPEEPGERYWHDDSAGDTEQRLRVLGMLARYYDCEGVFFHRLPYTSELAAHLRRMDCEMTVEYRSESGYLIGIVDLVTTLRAMAGELSRRLARSHLAEWCGELLIEADGVGCGVGRGIGGGADRKERAVLCIERSEVHVGTRSQTAHRLEGDGHVAQLLVGTYPPLEVVRGAGLALSGEAQELVQVLFPHQHPQMPNEDL